jgi:hypothetical protein
MTLRLVSEDEKLQQQTVERLTEALNIAKAGKMRSVLLVYENSEGELGVAWTGTPSISERIGKLQILIHRLISQAFGG